MWSAKAASVSQLVGDDAVINHRVSVHGDVLGALRQKDLAGVVRVHGCVALGGLRPQVNGRVQQVDVAVSPGPLGTWHAVLVQRLQLGLVFGQVNAEVDLGTARQGMTLAAGARCGCRRW